MITYNDELDANWPNTLTKYSSYHPERRIYRLLFLILALLALLLSVIAIVITFAVSNAWFHDKQGNYGLWRICLFIDNSTQCGSWFDDGKFADRLNQTKVPINVWQALQIVFLILTTATLAATIATTICYRFKRNARFYLALLASFIALPAVCIGLSSLFVFGFSVYNVRFYQNADPKLDWCFYLNIVAVILALIGFILLSIYDCLVKKPVRNDNDTVLNTLEHIDNFQSPIGPFSYQIVTQSKKKTRGFNDKRTKSYIVRPIQQHLPILTPYSSTVAATTNDINRSTYITNHQPLLTPYTSNSTSATHIQQYQSQIPQDYSYQQNTHRLLPSQSTTQINQIHPRQPQQLQLQTQTFEPRLSARQSPSYRPSYWHNTKRSNTSNGYLSEPDYVSRGIMYSPGITIQNTPFQNRYNGIVEQQFLTRGSSGAPPIHREPRVMHYYTGFDYFAALDPTDERELNARRLTVNPSYIQQQEDYIGTM